MLSHLIALCDAKATTTSHAHEVSERPPQKWFFASHHKTGTILLDAILEPIKGLFNPKLSYRLYYSHHIHESVSWSSDVFKYNLIDGQAWARIAHSGHSGIRVVHLIREPVELANAWCFAACALFCCARRLRRRYARFTDEAGPSAASPSSNTAGTELRQGAARRESTGGEHPGVR